MSSAYVQMAPGIGSIVTANMKALFTHRSETFLAQGRYIDGTKSRDPSNTTDVGTLQPGMVMGKIAAGNYAPSIYGLTNGALTSAGTTLTLATAAIGTEISRRKGATGTFKMTGPPTAAGVVRTMTITYSAISSTSVTITAAGVNAVQTVNMNIASTGGNIVLKIPKSDGTFILTTPSAWSATDATYLSNLQAVLDVASGVANGIVATAISATDTDLGFVLTFSGTGYAALPQPLVTVETLMTSTTSAQVTSTTAGVDGRFVTGSLIQPVDGSEVPLTLTPDWDSGIKVTDSNGVSVSVVDFAKFPTGGEIDCAQIINYPADASTRTWLQTQLSTLSGGKFSFSGTGGIY